jgi:hypothetical protein
VRGWEQEVDTYNYRRIDFPRFRNDTLVRGIYLTFRDFCDGRRNYIKSGLNIFEIYRHNNAYQSWGSKSVVQHFGTAAVYGNTFKTLIVSGIKYCSFYMFYSEKTKPPAKYGSYARGSALFLYFVLSNCFSL